MKGWKVTVLGVAIIAILLAVHVVPLGKVSWCSFFCSGVCNCPNGDLESMIGSLTYAATGFGIVLLTGPAGLAVVFR